MFHWGSFLLGVGTTLAALAVVAYMVWRVITGEAEARLTDPEGFRRRHKNEVGSCPTR